MKYAILSVTLLMQSFIGAMGEKAPLLSPVPVELLPITDTIRQKIESRFIKSYEFNKQSKTRIIRSINTHTRGNAIQWDAVAKDLESAPRKFSLVPLKRFLLGSLTPMAMYTAASLFGVAHTISDVHSGISGNRYALGNKICIAPDLVSSLTNGSAVIFLLMELMKYKQYFLLKSPEFKQLLNDVDNAESSDQLSQLMSHKNNFSKSEQRLLQHAQDSSLLSNGTFDRQAFKFALKELYPLSNLMFHCMAGTAILNIGSAFCIVPDYPILGFAPLLFNLLSILIVSQLSIGEYNGKYESNFSEIIQTIRGDLARQPEVIKTEVTQVNVINEEV
jgi:hypothetical protein